MTENLFQTPSLRLVQLHVLLLSSRRQYSLSRLAQIFKCSRQTVLRMIESIARVPGVQLDTWREGRERFYRAVPPGSRPELVVDSQSLKNLSLCQDIVQHLLPESIKEELRQFLGAAAFLAADAQRGAPAIDSFAEGRGKGMINYTPFQQCIEDVQRAMEGHRLCRVEHRTRLGDTPRKYLFGPQKLVAFREALYVRGRTFDAQGRPDARKPITLAIHRICRLRVTGTAFTPLPDTDTGDFFGFQFNEPFKARVWFSPDVATYVAERTWSRDQHLRRRADGSVVLTFTSTSRPEVKSFVMGFGGDAELLEPAGLRKETAAALARAADRYGNGGAKACGPRRGPRRG